MKKYLVPTLNSVKYMLNLKNLTSYIVQIHNSTLQVLIKQKQKLNKYRIPNRN